MTLVWKSLGNLSSICAEEYLVVWSWKRFLCPVLLECSLVIILAEWTAASHAFFYRNTELKRPQKICDFMRTKVVGNFRCESSENVAYCYWADAAIFFLRAVRLAEKNRIRAKSLNWLLRKVLTREVRLRIRWFPASAAWLEIRSWRWMGLRQHQHRLRCCQRTNELLLEYLERMLS